MGTPPLGSGLAFFHGARMARMLGSEAPMNVQLPVRMDKAAFLECIQGRQERYELDRDASS